MSKRLKVVFYLLFILFVIQIFANIHSFFVFGLEYSIANMNWIYFVAIIVIAFFVFKKSYYILPICFTYMTYKLLTTPILGIPRLGLKAIKQLYYYFGFNQGFFLFLSSWTIPIVSLVGCIFWYLDVKNSKSLDKHWSE
ncbi:hypothetical protein IBE48_00055 [Francisella philomiragia]|uniref:Membrane protein n=1 Tax=Francisella philomiragia TaxID=28110 RepID=A0AAW3D9G0_9GAMM|nr:hypothetical protein [Francisella philomiragia]KFJ42221.1 putative membrane protein [Francisella philomiragia]MBK2254319.1 hypothetical protein [Francisella philomiragia]MBK2272632.1 hypothetical protein [Francisella philomiragia]MBK2276473.1 hypothetical protein [Francisella philomiragia]MBK2280420.1 hypothetical protein [Francisella philomiragia]